MLYPTHRGYYAVSHTQGGIIGVNLFFLFRIIKGQDRDSGAGGTTGGYASFPEGQEPPGGDETPAYTPPEY